MRRSDTERLSLPYGSSEESPTPGPAAALGVDAPRLEALAQEILGDFSAGPPFGIGWWAPGPGTSRRILIGDQLHTCASSTLDNLVEAALHWLEFVDYSEQESDMFADAVRFVGGEFHIRSPRRVRPLDDVVLDMSVLHLLGVVRSVSGALDCLAGVIVGVTALKTSILKADFGRARATLGRISTPITEGERAQADFAVKLEQLVDAAGPTGWLNWALDFRNMLVHRGRRLTISQFVPRSTVLFGPDNRPVPRVRVVRQLPRDPGRSDVEVFRDPSAPPVLTEDALQTLEGLIRSTRELVNSAADELLAFWKWRRENPATLSQPVEQWRDGASAVPGGFSGYSPGGYAYSPSMLMSHPVVVRRLQTAALDDDARSQWPGFD